MSSRRREWMFVLSLALLSVVYVALRFSLNREYAGARWNDLSALRAPAPFGRRVLVPLITRPLVLEGMSVRRAFAGAEFVATFALGTGLRAALARLVRADWADVGALLLVALLAPLFLVQLRWPVFYPYDTPALAFAAWTLAWVLDPRPRLLPVLALAFFATLNRESYLLVAAGTLFISSAGMPARRLLVLTLGLGFACLGARCLAFTLTEGIARPYGGELAWAYAGRPRFVHNLQWLALPANFAVMATTIGLAPGAYFALYRGLPERLRRVGTVALALFAASFAVGNVYEPRAFGEAALFFYVPALRQVAARVPSATAMVRDEPLVAVGEHQGLLFRYQEWWLMLVVVAALTMVWAVWQASGA